MRALHSHFSARFRTFQQLGLVSAAVDPALIAHFQIGIFDELLNAVVLANPDADLDALASHLADFEWNGLRPDRKE